MNQFSIMVACIPFSWDIDVQDLMDEGTRLITIQVGPFAIILTMPA